MLSLRNVDAQLINVQSTTFKESKITIVIDALLPQITLSFKSKIIKFEMMKTYKN